MDAPIWGSFQRPLVSSLACEQAGGASPEGDLSLLSLSLPDGAEEVFPSS